MATVEDVATLVLGATDVSADRPIPIHTVAKWVDQRYKQLCARVRFRNKRRIGVLNVPATLNTGTVTATRDSATIALSAAADAVVTSAVIGRHIRVSTVWYKITAYATPNITIETAFTENTVTAGGYTILAREVLLDTDARWLGKVVHQRLRTTVEQRSLHALDWAAPDRVLASGGPYYYAESGRDVTTGAMILQLYPGTTTSETLNYVYWSKPSDLILTSTIPEPTDEYVLREGVLIDLFRYRASQELNAGRQDVAGFWRNESRSQVTSWEREVMEAIRADRGTDDITMMMQVLGQSISGGRGDIYDAKTELFARGNRP